MKRMKIALIAILAVVMGTTFTSCLNSDSESSWDFGDTASGFASMYGEYFVCDTYGYTIYPTNAAAVFPKGLPERAIVYFKLKEGEVLTEGKTSYEAAIVDAFEITVKEFCDRKDTLSIDTEDTEYGKGSPIFSQIAQPIPFKNYLNVAFVAAVSEQKFSWDYFNMYPEKADGNTLYVTLHQDEVTENEAYTLMSLPIMNFIIPEADKLEAMLGTEEYDKLTFFGSGNDSINIVISAKSGSNDNTVSSKPGKIRIIGAGSN